MIDNARDNPAICHRRSCRLQGYDYSQGGAYFITICVQNRECLFGGVADGEMHRTGAGQMVQTVWDEMVLRFNGLELDTFCVMPNHIHGLIVLSGRMGESCIRPREKGDHKDRPYGTLPGTVGRIIQAFKSITTHEYSVGVKKSGWPQFQGKLWQRNYWDHIIRNETELNHVLKYIQDNPVQWESDKLYREPGGRFGAFREPAADYGLVP